MKNPQEHTPRSMLWISYLGRIFDGEYCVNPLLRPDEVSDALTNALPLSEGGKSEARDWIENWLETDGHVLYNISLTASLRLQQFSEESLRALDPTQRKLVTKSTAEHSADLTKLDVQMRFLDQVQVVCCHFYSCCVIHEKKPLKPSNVGARVEQLSKDTLLWHAPLLLNAKHRMTWELKGFVVLDLRSRSGGFALQSTLRSSNDHIPEIRQLLTVVSSASMDFALRVERPVFPWSFSVLDPELFQSMLLSSSTSPQRGGTDENEELRTLLHYGRGGMPGEDLDVLHRVVRVGCNTTASSAVLTGENNELVTSAQGVGWRSNTSHVIRAHPDTGYVLWNFSP